MPAYFEAERRGRDSENRPEMKLKITAAFCFSKRLSHIEYYHNSSWLEHGALQTRLPAPALCLPLTNISGRREKYTKNESKILFQDIQDSLVLVTNCFSTPGKL